ncbi:MAG: hypothetical protein JW959_07660 [Pirellulales bacterium]|nr:hypothetical protein [Pirellulales bacterium]
MNDKPTTTVEGVLIGREHWDVPVRVEARSYMDFDRRMDCQLRWLLIRWSHAASPAATNVRHGFRGLGHETRFSPKRRPP